MELILVFLISFATFFLGYFWKESYKIKEKGIAQKEIEKIAQKNFNAWLEALQTKDSCVVAKLYHDELTFHPTASGDFKKGQSGAEEYFIHFLQKNPNGKLVEDHVKVLTSEIYLHSGLYDFEIDNNDKREIVEARFSFLWILDNGVWKIIHHHSSPKPRI